MNSYVIRTRLIPHIPAVTKLKIPEFRFKVWLYIRTYNGPASIATTASTVTANENTFPVSSLEINFDTKERNMGLKIT